MTRQPPDEPSPDAHHNVEYFVVCRQPLPARDGGWDLDLGNVVMIRELTEIPPSLRHAAGAVKIGQVIHLVSPAEAERLCALMAVEFSSSSRGLIIARVGWEPRASHRTLPVKWARAADLERALHGLVKKHLDED